MPGRSNSSDPSDTSATLDSLRAEVLGFFRSVPGSQRDVRTAIPYLSFIRLSHPTELTRGMLEPSMCMVIQGRKRILIGKEITDYGSGSFAVSAIDMPVSGQVVEASAAVPYLGVKFELDPKEVAALIIEADLAVPESSAARLGAYVEESDPDLQDAFLRLVRLLGKPKDLAVLSGLVKQEILYRLLTAPGGDVLYTTLRSHYKEKAINEAIHWIRKNYSRPMKIEKLAKAVNMSVSTLHHRFKALTTMSPLQYQKQLRLTQARKLLLGGNIEAATAAFNVGYESPSQFSREYRRFFGASPLQDGKHGEPRVAAL
jgi:AraC-like DNA-binding protein